MGHEFNKTVLMSGGDAKNLIYKDTAVPAHSERQKIPVPPKFEGTGTLSEGAGESADPRVRFVEPAHSDLYGNITTFGESGIPEARSAPAFFACVIVTRYLASF